MAIHCAQKLRLSKFLAGLESYVYNTIPQRSFASSDVTEIGTWQGRPMKIVTGKYARLADSCAVAECENTAVMVTVVGKRQTSPSSIVPLTVDFRQKSAAYGRIPTNYFRRDRGATEQEILTGRLVDRSLRPLFPSNINYEMQVTCNVLSMDENGDLEVLAINAASSALALSSMPWNGPVGAVRVCSVGDEVIVNPTRAQSRKSQIHILIVGFKSNIIMMDMSASGVSSSLLFSAIRKGLAECEAIAKRIKTLATSLGKTKIELTTDSDTNLYDLDECVRLLCEEKVLYTFSNPDHDKQSRDEELKSILKMASDILIRENPSFEESSINSAFYKLAKKVYRGLIMNRGIRCDGRELNQVRDITCETSLYPPLHGSSIFQRGQTQVLCTLALDSHETALKLDPYSQIASGLKEKNFFLHYEFPQYAVNEIGRTSSVGRREYGHGALAERALRPVIPKDYPFTIRLTSEVLESNGSSSMASICAGTLALLDAGVPITSPVSGVAMGLITETTDENPSNITDYRVLTDIMGIEDYFGDIDFKVACSRDGFTAAQLDMKIAGLPTRIVFEALIAAQQANASILKIMNATIKEPRKRDDGMLPVVESLEIPMNKVGKLLGVGGQNMRRLLVETGAHLSHVDGSKYSLFAPNAKALADAKEFIESAIKDQNAPTLEFGCIYTAKISEVRNSGVMVTLFTGMAPQLVPNGQLDLRKVSHPSALGLQEGQEIQLKYFGRDPSTGNMRLSRKVLQGTSGLAYNLGRENTAQVPLRSAENSTKTDI